MKSITWTKGGRILDPKDAPEWRAHFSGMVCVLPLDVGRYRMFLTGVGNDLSVGLGEPGRRQIGWLDLDDEFNVIHEAPDNPVLEAGEPGCFDCNGLCMPMVVRVSDTELYMYYIGWGPGTGSWFDNRAGLAISHDNGDTWSRWSRAPLALQDEQDPIGGGTAFVELTESGLWRLWYTSFRNLERRADGSFEHYYHIKYAESSDGVHWIKPGDNVVLDFEDEAEVAVARPSIIREPDGYRIWFCTRRLGEPYQIGYAESADGLKWERKPSGIEPSGSGWDSEMVEYAYVIKRDTDYVMFYNGNGYGATGTGIALGKEES